MTDEGRRRTKAPSAPLPDATERADGEERAPQPGPAQESREQPEATGESREQPEATETEVARATEPGAWAAIHARQVRGRRPGRRGRRQRRPPKADSKRPKTTGRV